MFVTVYDNRRHSYNDSSEHNKLAGWVILWRYSEVAKWNDR